jgi:tRNA G10  N-methylase Trm11
MALYAFQLGRKHFLCAAELEAVLGVENLVEKSNYTAIFELENLADFATGNSPAQDLQDRLGGTIKIIEITHQISASKIDNKALEPDIEDLITTHFSDAQGKTPFAITTLGFGRHSSIYIKKLLNFSKKILKDIGGNCRFVNKDERNPKPSTIYKAKVIEKGIDINILKGENTTYLGKSIAIQNINDYSKRDFDKPGRDARVGMLPPKLAQIMLNLTNSKPNSTIYDPFCGTGTTLMEAMLVGHDVVGSDISRRMVDFTERNCRWLSENFNTQQNFRVFERDACFITQGCLQEEIDTIVTEGYLGNPVSKLPSDHEREVTFRQLANMHLNWLRAVNPLLPEKARIVTCTAVFRHKNFIEHLPRFKEIANNAGYKIIETYTYDRPDQVVARDIQVLEKY